MTKRVWMGAALALGMMSGLAGCGVATIVPADKDKDTPAADTAQISLPPLPEFMDCVRETKGVLIASHRGGPAPGYPENAIETMQYGLDQGILVFEIDVAESQDGTLYLMHDRSLRRTAGYDGGVADTDWSVVKDLDLRDINGELTGFNPPTLKASLEWAVAEGAVLELDRKETTSFRNIIEEVRAAGAENNVLMISYNDDQAIQIAKLAPDLMMTAGIDSADHQRELEAAGVNFDHVVAWLGTRNPNPRAFAAIGSRGVETAFGTLGRPGERLDDEYIADGDASEYQALVDGGLTLIATDEPYFVARELEADDLAIRVCAK